MDTGDDLIAELAKLMSTGQPIRLDVAAYKEHGPHFVTLGEAARRAGVFENLDRIKAQLDRAASAKGSTMNIQLIEAEHFSTAGRVVRAFFDESAANAAATEIVNKMLADSPYAEGQQATVETWEDFAIRLGEWHGAAHCYVQRTLVAVEKNPRRWSFIINWWDGQKEQGDYAWSGEADTRDEALALAYEAMWADSENDGETFDLEVFRDNRSVTEEWHGTDPWA